jgi:hypothetical protein
VIKQSKAFVRKVSYSYGIRLIDEVSQASSATCWYGIKQVLELIAQADQLSIRAIPTNKSIKKICGEKRCHTA